MANEEDPRGGEACVKFLEENKKKEGVVTLASGLQYKALIYGTGLKHPQVDAVCSCYYKGMFIDGSEFDSSFSRSSKPTDFPVNRVIKGWTEALQLMVEGDKWELYIPYNLAYGEAGKAPKIPPRAALVFQMELEKIQDAKLTTPVVFPEWTPEDLALWEEKDEKPIQDFREKRIKSFEEGKLKDTHATREGFDEWLARACKASKDKALWARSRKAKNKLLLPLEPPAAPKVPAEPKLTKEKARELLTKALGIFKLPDNKSRLKAVVGENAELDGLMKMMKLMPIVQEMLGGTIKEYGFEASDLMTVTMQIQAFSGEDASIAADTAKLMKAVQGDFADLLDE